MIPCSCAASSASAICLAMGSASSIGIAPACDAIRERRSFDQLHHERRHAGRTFQAIDRRNVRMIERGQNFCLTLEARQPLDICRHRRGQHLDSHSPLQVGVGGLVHLPHATHADLGGDFVRTEAGAGSQGQDCAGIIRAGRAARRDSSLSETAGPFGRGHRLVENQVEK